MRAIRLTLVLILIFALRQSGSAEAREMANVFVNYSILNGDLTHNASGWEIGYTQNFRLDRPKPFWGIQGIFSAHHESVPQGHIHLHDLMVGSNLQHALGTFTVSAHALAGFAHTGGTLGSHNGFASAIGGNFDWDINPIIGIRLASVDWYQTHLLGSSQQDVRFSAGVVLRLVGFFDGPGVPPPRPPDHPQSDGTESH